MSIPLTKDPMPFLTLFVGMAAGLMLIFGGIKGYFAYESLHSLSLGAPETFKRCDYSYPPVCEDISTRASAYHDLGVAAKLFAAAAVTWAIARRKRIVRFDEPTKSYVVYWGEFLPVRLHKYALSELSSFSITREARFMVTPAPGGPTRSTRLPDRFRLRALFHGKQINLGSYATQEEAQHAIKQI